MRGKARENTFTDFVDSVLNSKAGQEVAAALSDGIRKRFGVATPQLNQLDFGRIKKEAMDIGEEIRKETYNPYKVLGLSQDAEESVIRAAWKAKAKLYHPDNGKGGDNKKMSEINKAYQDIAKQRHFTP